MCGDALTLIHCSQLKVRRGNHSTKLKCHQVTQCLGLNAAFAPFAKCWPSLHRKVCSTTGPIQGNWQSQFTQFSVQYLWHPACRQIQCGDLAVEAKYLIVKQARSRSLGPSKVSCLEQTEPLPIISMYEQCKRFALASIFLSKTNPSQSRIIGMGSNVYASRTPLTLSCRPRQVTRPTAL